MTREIIIERVKARIDELSPFTSEELNPTSQLIDKLLDDSTTALVLGVPVQMITPTAVDGVYTHVENQDGTGKVELPDDFLKLHTFKMSTWKTAVHAPTLPTDTKYNLQKSTYTMGRENKPVVIIKSNPSPGATKYLYYYSVDPSAPRSIAEFYYIPTMGPTDLEDHLVSPLAWLCAADVLQVLGELKAVEQARAQFNSYIISANI